LKVIASGPKEFLGIDIKHLELERLSREDIVSSMKMRPMKIAPVIKANSI
jgi:hypothetical protein